MRSLNLVPVASLRGLLMNELRSLDLQFPAGRRHISLMQEAGGRTFLAASPLEITLTNKQERK